MLAALLSFSGPARPQPTWSAEFTPVHSGGEESTPFCAAASSNGVWPTPSGLSQQYSSLLCDVGRGKQTTHTMRAQSHWHGLCHTRSRRLLYKFSFGHGVFETRLQNKPIGGVSSFRSETHGTSMIRPGRQSCVGCYFKTIEALCVHVSC